MYFQALDDKNECVGVYHNGHLHFEELPSNLQRTWRRGSVHGPGIEYAWLRCGGAALEEACPPELKGEYDRIFRKLNAFYKSFKIAKVDFEHHCVFDLIPHDALVEFCEIKNKITQFIFDTCERPPNYEFLHDVHHLLHDIRQQPLNIDASDCKKMFTRTTNRERLQRILRGAPRIDYNLFGTVTGRLATSPGSFPILTMKKDFRKILKPQNDWFVSLDYNGAEVRTVIALLEKPQPAYDVHEWNMQNIFKSTPNDTPLTRDVAKTLFFGWLYNPDSDIISSDFYDRDLILDKHYHEGYINTIFERKLEVDRRRAFNYLVQSTTSDLVIDRAVEIHRMLSTTKSHISHIVHDELVVDMADEDRHLLPKIKEIFAQNRLATFVVNLSAGRNYLEMEALHL